MTDLMARYRRLFNPRLSAASSAVVLFFGLVPAGVTVAILAVSGHTLYLALVRSYLTFALSLAAYVWALQVFRQRSLQYQVEALADKLKVVLREGRRSDPYGDKFSITARYSLTRLLLIQQRNSNLESATAADQRISLLALWRETEPLLTTAERRELERVYRRARSLRFFNYGCLLSIPPLIYIISTYEDLDTAEPVMLAFAAAFGAVASLVESGNSYREHYQLQVAATVRHSEEITVAYGLPTDSPQERQESMRMLSLSVLSGTAGNPSIAADSTRRETLEDLIDHSISKAVAPQPVVNLAGSVRFRRVDASPGSARLEVAIWTGDSAFTDADSLEDRQGFRVTGGIDVRTARIRFAVDSPGLQVIPRRAEAAMKTSGDSINWLIELMGSGADTAEAWLTLYCSDRFVRAVHIEAKGDEHARLPLS